ncbi:MAG: hypothetical protein GTO02_09315 [Candidatus Dadabacteria bacterium]|nr:hypothetical protein [Candidatus Dadabacteria bacterium]
MPTKQELLEYMRKYKKTNCPAVSGLKKQELETLAKKHGFGTSEMKTTQPTQTTQGKPSVVQFFKSNEKKQEQPKETPKAKPKPKKEKKKKDKYEGMTKEQLQAKRKELFEDMKEFNKVINDTEAKAADARRAADKKKKVLEEIKVVGEKIKSL